MMNKTPHIQYAQLMNFLPHFVPCQSHILWARSQVSPPAFGPGVGSRPSPTEHVQSGASALTSLNRHQACRSGDCCTAPVMSSIMDVIILSVLILQTKPGCRGSLSNTEAQCGVMVQTAVSLWWSVDNSCKI